MKKYFSLFVLVIIILTIIACNKYEYGPSVSLRSKKSRISKNWIVEKALVNGVEQSSLPRYEFLIKKSGTVEMYDTLINSLGADSLVFKTGLWEFDRNAENLILLFANNFGVQEARILRILKLTNDEFWYEERDSLDLVKIHLAEKIL
jgi:hypothetical protein